MVQSAFGRTAGGTGGGSLKRGANFGGGARSFGDSTGYSSTVTMNFRGQEKKQQTPGQLGNNPNIDPQDEYIVNLQQQIHFMELELKILKEKVLEDEQKSGIGSLYDDDKTSHQHISLLKTKYAQMKRDFDKQCNDLNKQSLKVKGQEFVLDAQIKIVKEQTQKLKDLQTEFAETSGYAKLDLKRTVDEASRARNNLESEIRHQENDENQTGGIHLSHRLQQDWTKSGDEESKNRHDQEVDLFTKLKTAKQLEKTKLEAELKKIEDDFLKMKEYQDFLAETARLRKQIEQDKVRVQYLEIQVKMLNEQTEYLNMTRDDLTEEKKLADDKNDELKTKLKAQEEIANKRLQNKLNREKSAKIKDLLAEDEMIKATNDDLTKKLMQEREQYDTYLKEKIELEERLARQTEELKIDTEVVKDQDILLAELEKQIEEEQKAVDDLEEHVAAGKKVSLEENDRNRYVQQQNTSLIAKHDFIEANYDYTTTPDKFDLSIFEKLVDSNKNVNKTISTFATQTETTKSEINQILRVRRRTQ